MALLLFGRQVNVIGVGNGVGQLVMNLFPGPADEDIL